MFWCIRTPKEPLVAINKWNMHYTHVSALESVKKGKFIEEFASAFRCRNLRSTSSVLFFRDSFKSGYIQ